MTAGDDVLYIFPGDTQPTPVPRNAIAQASAAGAKLWRRGYAVSDATDVAKPRVLPGSPPELVLNRVSPTAMSTLSVFGNQFGVRDPMSQLQLATKAADLIPPMAAGAADLASPGAARGIGLAGLTGALTEPIREGAYNYLGQGHMVGPMDPGSIARRSAIVGGEQMLGSGVGRGVSGAMGMMANVPEDLAGTSMHVGGQRGEVIGDVRHDFLHEAVPPGRIGSRSGTQAIEQRVTQSSQREDQLAARANRTTGRGVRVGPTTTQADLADQAYDSIVRRFGPALNGQDLAELQRLRTDAAGGVGPTPQLDVPGVLGFKRGHDAKAFRIHEKEAAHQGTGASAWEDLFSKEAGDAARQWLRTNTPELGAQALYTSNLMRLRAAMSHAENQGPEFTVLGMLANRRNLGRAALATRGVGATAGNRGAQVFMSQLPRLAGSTVIPPPDEIDARMARQRPIPK